MKHLFFLFLSLLTSFASGEITSSISQSSSEGGEIDLTANSYIAWGYDGDSLIDSTFSNVKNGTTAPTAAPRSVVADSGNYRWSFTFDDGTTPPTGSGEASSGSIRGLSTNDGLDLTFSNVVGAGETRRLTLYLGAFADVGDTISLNVDARLSGGVSDEVATSQTYSAVNNQTVSAVYILEFASETETDLVIDLRVTGASGSRTAGLSGYTLEVISGGTPPPAAPTGLAAIAGNASVSLDWDDNSESGVTYSLYRSQTTGVFSTPLVEDLATSQYTDSTAQNFTTYFYEVVAVLGGDNPSEPSLEVSATPADPNNQAPGFTTDPLITSNALEGTAYSASIASGASDPDSDPLTFSKATGPAWLSVGTDGSLSGTPVFADVGLNTFTVQVTAAGGTDTAELQITVEVDTLTPPVAPTGVSAIGGNAVVTIDWDDNLEGDLSDYTVYRATTSGDPGTAVGLNLTSSTYTDNSVSNGSTYYYTVVTHDIHGNSSDRSDEVSATPTEIRDRLSSSLTQTPGLGSHVDLTAKTTLAWGIAPGPLFEGFTNVKSGTTPPSPPGSQSASNDFGYTFTFDDGTNPVTGTAETSSGAARGINKGNRIRLTFEDVVSSTEERKLTLYLGGFIGGGDTIEFTTTASMTGGGSERSDIGLFSSVNGSTAADNTSSIIYTVEFASPTETDLVIDIDFTAANGNRAFGISGYVIEPVTGVGLPPSAITNLSSTHGDNVIDLDWEDHPESTITYNVYRSITSSQYIDDQFLATGLSSSSFSDATAQNDRQYYYIVTAVNGAGRESDVSTERSDTPFDPVLEQWEGTVRVFLVGGQSNAVGYDTLDNLTTSIDPFSVDFLESPGVIEDLYTRSQGSSNLGPEMGLGSRLFHILGDDPNHRIAVVKYAEGGTSLYEKWVPGGDATLSDDGPVYQAFQQNVADRMAFLGLKYKAATIQIEGMVWQQGEADANSGRGGNYETNLTNFVADLRLTYGSNLIFVAGKLSDAQFDKIDPADIDTVQAAQDAVAANDFRVRTVETDDLGIKPSDGIHFDADGLLEIGRRSAVEMAYVLWVGEALTPAQITADEGADTFDADGDGVTNRDEFIQGTSVSNANQLLVPEVKPAAAGGFQIEFTTQSGREYLLETSTTLEPDSWVPVGSPFNGSSGPEAVSIPTGDGASFFRVRSRLP